MVDAAFGTQPQAAAPAQEAAILDAARDLLAAGGIDGLSMRLVADRVGISATAIYHYFSGKRDLVNRVVLNAFERFGTYLEQAASSHPRGSLERIGALGEAYLQFALENQAYFRILFSIQKTGPEQVEEFPEGGGYHLLRQAVEDAVAAGTVRRANPDLISMYLWSCVHGLVTLALCGASQRCQLDGMPSAVELFRRLEPFVADGIRAPTHDGVPAERPKG